MLWFHFRNQECAGRPVFGGVPRAEIVRHRHLLVLPPPGGARGLLGPRGGGGGGTTGGPPHHRGPLKRGHGRGRGRRRRGPPPRGHALFRRGGQREALLDGAGRAVCSSSSPFLVVLVVVELVFVQVARSYPGDDGALCLPGRLLQEGVAHLRASSVNPATGSIRSGCCTPSVYWRQRLRLLLPTRSLFLILELFPLSNRRQARWGR
mmetsp:Transcript_10462/g.15639  ORF Transcript_10462/g.15639 Transcript_10462/m.15639 type:complete len:207 (+) Transcript_10462:369-989(+)